MRDNMADEAASGLMPRKPNGMAGLSREASPGSAMHRAPGFAPPIGRRAARVRRCCLTCRQPRGGNAPARAKALARLEVVRVMDLLYAIDERDLIAGALADLGERSTDAVALDAQRNGYDFIPRQNSSKPPRPH
jgi:hypothetical protein